MEYSEALQHAVNSARRADECMDMGLRESTIAYAQLTAMWLAVAQEIRSVEPEPEAEPDYPVSFTGDPEFTPGGK